MKPVVDRLREAYSGKVEFQLYDIDNNPKSEPLMKQYNAQYVPTFVFLNRDGSVSQRKVGETNEAEMRAALDALR